MHVPFNMRAMSLDFAIMITLAAFSGGPVQTHTLYGNWNV